MLLGPADCFKFWVFGMHVWTLFFPILGKCTIVLLSHIFDHSFSQTFNLQSTRSPFCFGTTWLLGRLLFLSPCFFLNWKYLYNFKNTCLVGNCWPPVYFRLCLCCWAGHNNHTYALNTYSKLCKQFHFFFLVRIDDIKAILLPRRAPLGSWMSFCLIVCHL